MTIKSFRDLRVWQAAMDLVEETYRLTRQFPNSETFGLASQMQRAVVSVPSNIAEGHTREHTKEYLHHLSMAQASLAELETQVEIATRLAYLTTDSSAATMEQIHLVGKQIYALRNALARGTRPPTPDP